MTSVTVPSQVGQYSYEDDQEPRKVAQDLY